MFACLFLPTPSPVEPDALEAVARAFSPRVEVHHEGHPRAGANVRARARPSAGAGMQVVTLDVRGLQRLLGSPADIGRELLREARARGCEPNVALAATQTAAMLLAFGRQGLTVVPSGEERKAVARLPLRVLAQVVGVQDHEERPPTLPDLLERWGLRTVGELAALPAPALSERIGQGGLRWQRAARGEDREPLVAMAPEPPIEETLDLEWPVEGLEPLSFLLPRLIDPICDRLERLDQAAVTLEMSFRLATHEDVVRRLPLPAPMRDAKVLRTLVLLHLESHPLGAGVDRLTLRVEPAPARIVQFSLLSRALPFPEQMATLVARLSALMGERRVGSPVLVDSHRPGAFAMEAFRVGSPADVGRGFSSVVRQAHHALSSSKGVLAGSSDPAGVRGLKRPAHTADLTVRPTSPQFPSVALRRFRLPVPARVLVQDGRPVRVTTERRGLEGGRVEAAAGPWRTSGEWWRAGEPRTASPERGHGAAESNGRAGEPRTASPERGHGAAESNGRAGEATSRLPAGPWSRDEWDVALSDGAVYRICQDRTSERWFLEGIVD